MHHIISVVIVKCTGHEDCDSDPKGLQKIVSVVKSERKGHTRDSRYFRLVFGFALEGAGPFDPHKKIGQKQGESTMDTTSGWPVRLGFLMIEVTMSCLTVFENDHLGILDTDIYTCLARIHHKCPKVVLELAERSG